MNVRLLLHLLQEYCNIFGSCCITVSITTFVGFTRISESLLEATTRQYQPFIEQILAKCKQYVWVTYPYPKYCAIHLASICKDKALKEL